MKSKAKTTMADCLTNQYETPKRKKTPFFKDNTSFKPKYNDVSTKNISHKNNAQSFSCFGNTSLSKVNKESNSTRPKPENQAKGSHLSELNHKERGLKSLYPDLSKEEIKLLANRDIRDENAIKENRLYKTAKQFDSNIFNNQEKENLNKNFIKLPKTPKKEEKLIEKKDPKAAKAKRETKYEKETKERAKSAIERKRDELYKSNLFNIESTSIKDKDSTKVSIKKKKESSFVELMESQPKVISQNKNLIEKSYSISWISLENIKEKELKSALLKIGIHVTKLSYKYDLVSNKTLNNQLVISVREERLKTNHSQKIKNIIPEALVQEIEIKEKAISNPKPISDLKPIRRNINTVMSFERSKTLSNLSSIKKEE